MAIYEVTSSGLSPIDPVGFADVQMRERADLQRLVRGRPEVLGEELLIVAEEFGEFEDARRRIDLLALDKSANLVVIELKRTEDGGHMDLQAIRYAAMVRAMDFDGVVAEVSRLQRCDASRARDAVLAFLDWDEPDPTQFAQDVRIILASADFGRELTSAVLWLNEHDLDIRCVRVRPHRDGSRVLLDVQQVIPLPEAATYQIKLRAKTESAREARRQQSGRHDLYQRFWTAVQHEASASGLRLHADVQPPMGSSMGAATKAASNTYYNYCVGKRNYRVQLDLWGVNPKATFDRLARHRSTVDATYGEPLTWDRADEGRKSMVSAEFDGTPIEDEANWPVLARELVDRMRRFDAALRPALVKADADRGTSEQGVTPEA